MGWFDQETKDDGGSAPVAAPVTQQRAATAPAAGSHQGSSTIGQRVQINGTVVSDEDLEIVGKVEGTIHTRKGLRVGREAEVKAVINGTEVLVEGSVKGDINASEKLVLGATAVLTGNIKTPSLEIRDGAFFRGQVTMQHPERAAEKPKAQPKTEAKQRSVPAAPAADNDAKSTGDGVSGKANAPAAKSANDSAKPASATGA